VLYFFNPFQREIMAQVLSNIEKSLRERPREIYIVYRTPLLGALMDQANFLKKVQNGTWIRRVNEHYLVCTHGVNCD
jgi:hypothetical protein